VITESLATAVAYATVYFFQDYMLFNPRKKNPVGAESLPPRFREVVVETSDGVRLKSLYFKGDEDKPAIIWNQGQSYDIWKMGFVAHPYINAGYSVYLTGYRGFNNPGKFSEKGFVEDIKAGYDFLKKRGHDKIVGHGYSMGCAFTARFAATRQQLQAVILEAPFANLRSVIMQKYEKFTPALHLLKYDMNTESWVGQVTVPTLVIHGGRDSKVPASNGEKVFAASAASVKEKIIIPDGTHYLYQFGSGKMVMNWLKNTAIKSA